MATRRVWRFRLLAVGAAVVLVALGVAFVMLLSAPKATVDDVVIVTLPSGADVYFDGKPLGPAPVKLADVRVGEHTIRAEKAGFSAAETTVSISQDDDDSLELKLKPIAPPGSVARTPAEQIAEFTSLAEDAFARDDMVVPADRSALYYADAILSLDPKSEYARALRDRILERLLADAKAAASRKDLLHARSAYEHVLELFPNDEEARNAVAAIEEQLRREESRVQEFLAAGRRALRDGRLVEPEGRSAHAYAMRALAADPNNSQALALDRQARARALARAKQTIESDETEQAVATLRRLAALYPDDRAIRAELDSLQRGRALDDFRAHRDAGLEAYAAGEYRRAVDELGAAARLGALDARAYEALGLAQMKIGNQAEAKSALERATIQEPARASSLVALGSMAERRGDRRAAARFYRRAAKAGGTPAYPVARLEELAAALDAGSAREQKP
jgi:tetratricopeptide (TPR) repeat protein